MLSRCDVANQLFIIASLNCEFHWYWVKTSAPAPLKAPSLWKRNKAQSCECSALSKNAACSVRMRAGGLTQMTGIWRMPLLPATVPTCTCLAIAPPLKHAEPLCWQIDERCAARRCRRTLNRLLFYVGRSYLPAKLWSFSSSSEAQPPRWQGHSAWVVSQSCRCTSLEVRLWSC